LDELSAKTGRGIIGNKAASGTEIIVELGEQHVATGDLIVYTSADSVLQICAHEEVVPLDELYEICHIAREITLKDEWKVGRIIARPFVGTNKDNFKRTANRHDYALEPTERTTLNELADKGLDVISIGKISDIFNKSGVTEGHSIKSNKDGMIQLTELMDRDFEGFSFTNLVDFDALYGHRRDPEGYKNALEEFDVLLADVVSKLRKDDLLIITADHGNDPTMPGTDHTREYVPLIIVSPELRGGFLDVRDSFADLGATIADNFNVTLPRIGKSFLGELK
jgi:phosphopentomutase